MSLWSSTFNTTCHYRRPIGYERGSHVYGEAVPFRCNLQAENRLIRLPTGEQTASSYRIWTDVELKPNDLIYLPGEDTELTTVGHVILTVGIHRHLLTGEIDHYQVTL